MSLHWVWGPMCVFLKQIGTLSVFYCSDSSKQLTIHNLSFAYFTLSLTAPLACIDLSTQRTRNKKTTWSGMRV